MLPYLVDVACHGDGDLTPYAQTTVTDGPEFDPSEDENSLFATDDQCTSLEEIAQTHRDACPRRSNPESTVFPLHHPFLAAFTTRPPPTL